MAVIWNQNQLYYNLFVFINKSYTFQCHLIYLENDRLLNKYILLTFCDIFISKSANISLYFSTFFVHHILCTSALFINKACNKINQNTLKYSFHILHLNSGLNTCYNKQNFYFLYCRNRTITDLIFLYKTLTKCVSLLLGYIWL